ncbi:MAG: SDR family NAD(P)-dependent oxidoreductase [Candidatus Aminicenantales bacterium]
MEERVVLVTAGSGGLGKDIAMRLSEVISGVAVHYYSRRREALAVKKLIRKKGKQAASIRADLTREKQAAALVRKVEKEFGRLDILVNNFGPILVKPWQNLTAADWEFSFRSNLLSAYFCMKAALPGMRKRRWGRIINIGYSRAEQLTAFPNIAAYAVAKTGLLILTRTAAASVASSGITVNMVSPGLIKGGALPSSKVIPKGRLGRFKDISEAVLFLASDNAGYITGTNLIVAGGWKM